MTTIQYICTKTIGNRTHVWALAASNIGIPSTHWSTHWGPVLVFGHISVYGTVEDGVISRRILYAQCLRKKFRIKQKKGYVISHDSTVLNLVTQQLEKHDCWELLAGPVFDKFRTLD